MSVQVVKKPLPTTEIENAAYATPDFIQLRAKGDLLFPVLIYDDQKSGHKWHTWLEDGVYFGMGQTVAINYLLKVPKFVDKNGKVVDADFPLAFQCQGDHYRGRRILNGMQHLGAVRGEVWGLPLRGLVDLDMYSQNTFGTLRQKVGVEMLDRPNDKVQPKQMFMYLGDPSYWEPNEHSQNVLHWKSFEMNGYGWRRYLEFTGSIPK